PGAASSPSSSSAARRGREPGSCGGRPCPFGSRSRHSRSFSRQERTVYTACHDLARTLDLPERSLLQVLRPLVLAGVLDPLPGPGGGYRLARPAAAITVLEVGEVVDGPMAAVAPKISAADAALDRRLQAVCQDVVAVVRTVLACVRLAD